MDYTDPMDQYATPMDENKLGEADWEGGVHVSSGDVKGPLLTAADEQTWP